MISARHKSIQNASTYAMDAVNNFMAIQQSSESRNMNSFKVWQPIHVSSLLLLERITPHSVFKNKPIQYLAKWFFQKRLHLTPANSVVEAVTCASNTVTYQSPGDAFEQLEKFMSAQLPPQALATASGYMKQIAIQCALGNTPPDIAESPVEEIVPTTEDQGTTITTASLSSPTNVRKRYGTVTLDFRLDSNWWNLDLFTQVNMLVECVKIPSKQLTNSAKNFSYTTATPIARCIHHCFDSNIQRFIDHLQESGITKIRKGKKNQHTCPQCLLLASSHNNN
jgi:hypothetical protein